MYRLAILLCALSGTSTLAQGGSLGNVTIHPLDERYAHWRDTVQPLDEQVIAWLDQHVKDSSMNNPEPLGVNGDNLAWPLPSKDFLPVGPVVDFVGEADLTGLGDLADLEKLSLSSADELLFGDGTSFPSGDGGDSRQSSNYIEFGDNRQLAAGTYWLLSPGFRSNRYANNYDGTSTISGDGVNTINTLCFGIFEPFRRVTACPNDALTVNGGSPLCGRFRRKPFSGTSLAFRFTTNGNRNNGRFACFIRVPRSTVSTTTTAAPAATAQCCGIANRAARIVGGNYAQRNEYPWQVVVSAGGFCGGTIINTRWVLTAAHCTVSATVSQARVYAGLHQVSSSDPGLVRFSVVRKVEHPSYRFPRYDFSLLQLDRAITVGTTMRPACLPTNLGNTYQGAQAIVSGWGLTRTGGSLAPYLKELAVTVQRPCNHNSIICAFSGRAGQGVCSGDSGGPLIALENGRYTLIGAVSFGVSSSERPGCAAGYPDGYGRVTTVMGWINSVTAGSSLC